MKYEAILIFALFGISITNLYAGIYTAEHEKKGVNLKDYKLEDINKYHPYWHWKWD